MGKLLACLPRLTLAQMRTLWSTLQGVRARETLKTSQRPDGPMGDSRFARCLQGGGVAVYGGTVAISSCTITGNTANFYGGGIRVDGGSTVSLINCQVHSNQALSGGGGVFVHSGTMTLSSCTISGNTAPWGGGVFVDDTVSIVNSQLNSNQASVSGGSVAVWGGTVTIDSCTITGNTVSSGVRAHAQNFPSPPRETHVLLVVCSGAAVSTSILARSR